MRRRIGRIRPAESPTFARSHGVPDAVAHAERVPHARAHRVTDSGADVERG